MKKNKKLHERLKEYSNIPVPYDVWHIFGAKEIEVHGTQAHFGPRECSTDAGTISELRKAVEFYVDQLGGKVKWE